MNKTLFKLVSILLVVWLMAGCAVAPARIPSQPEAATKVETVKPWEYVLWSALAILFSRNQCEENCTFE